MRILRMPELRRITGLSSSTIVRMERRREFPPRLRLGGTAVGWREDEILQWINSLDRQATSLGGVGNSCPDQTGGTDTGGTGPAAATGR